MAAHLAWFALLAWLAGCTPPPAHLASQYRLLPATPPVVLAFAPGRDIPAPADAARLRSLGALLPAWVVPQLVADGPRALTHARIVRNLLGRPVVVSSPRTVERAADPDLAVLFLPTVPAILADDCRGPGQPVVGDLWPGDDALQSRLLPAGCAVAMALQAQVTAASGGGDLLQGRLLPPGATTPFTDAIEAYYRRNDPSQRASPAASSKSGNYSTSDTATPTPDISVQSGGAAPAPPATNPLLGPLPGARTQ